MYAYIYKFTLIPTNLIYIGKHVASKFDNRYYGSGVQWRKLVKQYGKNNVNREILEEIDVEDDDYVAERENFWINKFDSRNPLVGYNMAAAGKSYFIGCSHSEKTKEVLAEKTREFNHQRDYTDVSNHHLGAKMMTNGVEQRWVYRDEIEDLLHLGWRFRSCRKRKRNYEEHVERMRSRKCKEFTTKDRVAIYNVETLKSTFKYKEEAEQLVNSGLYAYGLKPKKSQ